MLQWMLLQRIFDLRHVRSFLLSSVNDFLFPKMLEPQTETCEIKNVGTTKRMQPPPRPNRNFWSPEIKIPQLAPLSECAPKFNRLFLG